MGSLIHLSGLFPDTGITCGCERQLRLLGAEPGRYCGMSLAAAVVAALAASVFFASSQFLVPGLLLAFALILGLMLALPGIEARKRAQEIEAAMPFFLRGLGMLLRMGIPWRRAMEIASEGSGALEKEISLVLRSMDEGGGFGRALSHLASFDSLAIKRAASQMASAYETGASGAEMMRMGDEMLALDMHRMREHGSRGAMLGLLFVLFTAIAPAFFLIYSVAGPMAFGAGAISGDAMALALLVVFPALGGLVLLLGKAMTPKAHLIEARAAGPAMFAPGFIMLAGLFLFPGSAIPVAAAGAAAGALLAFSRMAEERRLEGIDAMLPDALFCVSGMPGSSSAQRVFGLIEEGGFGALSAEAGKTRRQLGMNVGVGPALEDFICRNPTALARRAMVMMKHMIETGSLGRMGMLAEDMVRGAEAMRERSRQFSMQKYTLIFGALLLPAVFKMALGLSAAIAAIGGGGAGAGAEGTARLYIVIYANMAALAISDAEGRMSALPACSLALAMMGLAAFQFISF